MDRPDSSFPVRVVQAFVRAVCAAALISGLRSVPDAQF